MKIMGLDYGSKTVGIALTDDLMLAAHPYDTIFRDAENKLRKTCAKLEEIIKKEKVDLIVLGKPYNMDGTTGERVEKCTIFKEMLERRTNIKIEWQDERLTTMSASEILHDSGIKKSEHKKYIDSVAASIILNEYIEKTKKGN